MHQISKSIILSLLMSFIFCFCAFAYSGKYSSKFESGYQFVIKGYDGYLRDSEVKNLKKHIDSNGLSEYGDIEIIFGESTSAKAIAKSESGDLNFNSMVIAFNMDPDNREFYVYNSGEFAKKITNSESNSATDKVYKYFSKKRFYDGLSALTDSLYTAVSGHRVISPLTIMGNILLGFMISMFFVALSIEIHIYRKVKVGIKQSSLRVKENQKHLHTELLSTSRHRIERDSSSGGGGGFSIGGGGFSAGHSGGGHSF